jgi:hypothetical protein
MGGAKDRSQTTYHSPNHIGGCRGTMSTSLHTVGPGTSIKYECRNTNKKGELGATCTTPNRWVDARTVRRQENMQKPHKFDKHDGVRY